MTDRAGLVTRDTLVAEERLPNNENVILGLHKYPTTLGQCVVFVEGCSDIFSLDATAFVSLFHFVRRASRAICASLGVQRCALASDGISINLIPLHGITGAWKPVYFDHEEFYAKFPGYLTSKPAPKMDTARLEDIRQTIAQQSQFKEPHNTTFLGDAHDTNLFAQIIRGECEQWRVWEDDRHVAFLTPFGNTPGFTVVVPRSHLPTDILALEIDDYDSLVQAAYTIAPLLRRGLQSQRVGIFFEGFEIDYAHIKLIPVFEGADSDKADNTATYYDQYPGFLTTQNGPELINVDESFVGQLRAHFS